ncbi:XRE family transcriptional regulator [Micromonospora sp. LOL_015]|uniref:XRE family transcriptional regulator n=1 Tax=Micromonospora sp. LOL_015 TaxID=3345416 RepID=UPI003A8910E7
MANGRLREAILNAGLTPLSLAERVGVSPKTAERWITLNRVPYPRHRHAIAGLLKERESYLWPNAASPERVARVAESEVVHVYSRRSAVPYDLWRRLIEQSSERIGILVYAGLFLPELVPTLIRDLQERALAGVDVRLLLGNPESEAVAQRGAEEGIGDAIAGKVRNVMAFYNQLQDVPGVHARFHSTTLYNSIYRFDNEMLVNTHAYGFPAAHAPVFHLRRLSGGDLFDTYADSFDRVWSSAAPIWPPPVAG